jgi:anti-anti-sigma regulatory factor
MARTSGALAQLAAMFNVPRMSARVKTGRLADRLNDIRKRGGKLFVVSCSAAVKSVALAFQFT